MLHRWSGIAVVMASLVLAESSAWAQQADPPASSAGSMLDQTTDASAPDQLSSDDVLPPPPPPRPPSFPAQDIPAPRKKAARPLDSVAAEGIGDASLRLYPALDMGVVYATNPAQSSGNKNDDIALRVAPELQLRSDWSRHQLRLSGRAEYLNYQDNSDLNSLTGEATADFRLDIRRTTFADLSAFYSLDQTKPGDRDLPTSAAKARRDHDFGVGAALTHDFGGIEGRMGLAASRFIASDVDLINGTTEDNADRAYTQPSVSMRVSTTTGAVFNPFVELAYEPRFHDKRRDRNGIARDSHGVRALAGISFDDGVFWNGDIAATYLMRDFADGSLKTAQVAGLSGRISWLPSDLTTVTFTSAVDLDETEATNSSATRLWTFGLSAQHRMRDNVILSGGASVEIADGAGDADYTYDVYAGAEWQLNRYLALAGQYQGAWFTSGTPNGSYDDQRLIASMIVRH